MKGLLLALPLLVGNCYIPPKKVAVRLELSGELARRAAELKVLPSIAELRREVTGNAVLLELKYEAGRVRVVLPGACPLELELRRTSGEAPLERALKPFFDSGPSERVVGLGMPFELTAQPNCREAQNLRSSFVVLGGAPLQQVRVAETGRRFSASTSATPPESNQTLGIVPVSARVQQALRSEVAFRVVLPNGTPYERRLGISAVARSSGLLDVGLSHPVLLSGSGWRLLAKPTDSTATLRQVGALFELRPDATGRYALRDDAGHELSLHSGRYDQTPLDCGRSACHAEIARSVQDSPMTQVLASDLGGCHSLTEPTCASACHTTGEPGTADGGFTHAASEFELPQLPSEYDELPPALRRLGGVGCLACHGPTRIPEPNQRFALLRNGVCAVCHDAPPRYGHVLALEASRMGHADSSPEARNNPTCSRCHTAWGAVGRPGPADHNETFGLTCSTCHDVHPHGEHAQARAVGAVPGDPPSHGGLLRNFALPVTLPNLPTSLQGVSRVCVSCHAPSSSATLPEASAAALLAGQGGIEPTTGAAMMLAGPHTQAPKGCLSCHDSGPSNLVLGKSHGFRATEEGCARCHSTAPQRDPSLAARARRLRAELSPDLTTADLDRPWHARDSATGPTSPRTRALYDVLLVLEDPAADVHNPAYAQALLDAAERHGAKP